MEWMRITTELDHWQTEWMQGATMLNFWQSMAQFALCLWVWAIDQRSRRAGR